MKDFSVQLKLHVELISICSNVGSTNVSIRYVNTDS